MERLTGRSRREPDCRTDIADAVTAVLPVAEKTIDFSPVFAHRAEQVRIARRKLTEEDVKPVQERFRKPS